MESKNGASRMKRIAILLCLIFTTVGFECIANEWIPSYNTQQIQPVPVLQVQVYQAPAYTVMIPVVVQPQPVVQQRVVWGYPYTTMIVPVDQYRYWGYNRRCRLIDKY